MGACLPLWEANQPVCLLARLPAFELLFSKETEINFATIGRGQEKQQQIALNPNTTRKEFKKEISQSSRRCWSSLREHWTEESAEEIAFEGAAMTQKLRDHGDSTQHATLPLMVHLCPCQGQCESTFKLQSRFIFLATAVGLFSQITLSQGCDYRNLKREMWKVSCFKMICSIL